MAWTEMACVHHMGNFLVEPFILLENTGSREAGCLAEACTSDENWVHIKGVLRTFQFYISKLLYFSFSIKCNKDWGVQNSDKIFSVFVDFNFI